VFGGGGGGGGDWRDDGVVGGWPPLTRGCMHALAGCLRRRNTPWEGKESHSPKTPTSS